MGLAQALVRHYFDLSYRLLLGTTAGRTFLERAHPSDLPATHGYLTREDLQAVIANLAPHQENGPILDLGCGFGAVAIEVHRRSGSRVHGIDGSPRAIAEAQAAAARAGAQDAVTFEVGDFGSPPGIGASGAYAIDALMFVADPAASIRSAIAAIGPPGMVVATLLRYGGGEATLRERLASAGLDVDRLDDVTPALRAQSRRRRTLAGQLLTARSTEGIGRLAMLLVLVEEMIVGSMAAAGRLRRWRVVVRGLSPR